MGWRPHATTTLPRAFVKLCVDKPYTGHGPDDVSTVGTTCEVTLKSAFDYVSTNRDAYEKWKLIILKRAFKGDYNDDY